jgi:Holliday junction DNA helicase RuvB
LETLIGVFAGGPVGIEALSATMNLPVDTLSDEIEPYLLREQFTIRTPRGRIATSKAYNLLGKEVPIKENQEDDNPSQSTLF